MSLGGESVPHSRGIRSILLPTILGILFSAASLRADEKIRPIRPGQLASTPEKSVRVVGAKVSYVNYDALVRDFPALRGKSHQQIDAWVLDNFAYVSEAQAKLNGIRNSDIPTDKSQTKSNYRPEDYNRAAVLEATADGKPVGLVDVKGFGHSEDSIQGKIADQIGRFPFAHEDERDHMRVLDHSDGLMSHGEAIAELTRQAALQKVFDLYNKEHQTDFQTVESYFVIELPFHILKPDGVKIPAALYGRQAHWRSYDDAKTPAGVDTYTDFKGGRQQTRFGSVIDFGAAIITSLFVKEKFGGPEAGRLDPQESNPWIWGHDCAKAFAAGDEGVVYRHLAEMLSGIQDQWQKAEIPQLDAATAQARAAVLKDIADGKRITPDAAKAAGFPPAAERALNTAAFRERLRQKPLGRLCEFVYGRLTSSQVHRNVAVGTGVVAGTAAVVTPIVVLGINWFRSKPAEEKKTEEKK